ncbi:MAG: D-alanyl-D-alanine carboxypeptidase [Clostridia bacterium]|nr:D-alanyl-D-alanine carboxypeptidase [Clostridia bacterium]
MRRYSYKYIFLFNVVMIAAVFIVSFVIRKTEDSDLRVSITTPLIHSETLDVEFCKNAKAAVIIDAASGAVLYDKNASVRLPMASTTKIMTALAVIENSSPEDVITVSLSAAGVEGSSIYLAAGEKITVLDLLYGLMLESGNDAATALAEGVFGSVQACVDTMNEMCRGMGLVDTHFENPHGLDNKNHYTTAYELAVITREAMKNDLFRELVSAKSYVTGGEKSRYFSNHNRLLRSYPRAIGVKTGYTSKSGRCLVTATSENGEEYIAVTLCDSLDWEDHKNMHSFAFDTFGSREIADKESFCLYAGFTKYVPTEDIYITTSDDRSFKLNYRITIGNNTAKVDYSTDSMSLGSFYLEESVF